MSAEESTEINNDSLTYHVIKIYTFYFKYKLSLYLYDLWICFDSTETTVNIFKYNILIFPPNSVAGVKIFNEVNAIFRQIKRSLF